ncbi:MAG: DUF4154 domain-containing protein [Archangium sp.]|nr:DUF4154 domain-containing protein [Archangium sp.]
MLPARFASLLLALLLAGAAPAHADTPVDVKAAMPLLLKVLTYDVNFDARGVGPFVILVVSAPAQSKERERLVVELNELAANKVKTRPVKYVGADFVNEAQLQSEIDKSHCSALLAQPGMPLGLVKQAWEVTQDNQLYALALEAVLVEQVLPIGVSMSGDKAQIIINEKASRAVGVRFETSVLRLARVIQ